MLLKTAKLLGIDINPKCIWSTSKKFISYDEAIEFSNRVDGIIIYRDSVISKYKYIVNYNEYRHKSLKVEHKYHTINFSSYNSAIQFRDRLIREGLGLGINQNIDVKESKGLFKVKFLLDKSRPSKKDIYANEWCESNMDGSFAYNGVTDDF